MRLPISNAKVKVKVDRVFESSFSDPHINSGSLMPAFYIVYFPNEITARESIEIYIFLPVFPSCELVK